MKTIWSMRLNTMLFVIGGLSLLITGFVTGITVFSVQKISAAQSQSVLDSRLEGLASESKFNVVQIQQFLTDAALTGETDSIKEARENLTNLKANLSKIAEIDPTLLEQTTVIGTLGEKLAAVGLEMTKMYWKEGQAAGNVIMKRPDTGLDAMSAQLSETLDKFEKNTLGRQQESEKRVQAIETDLKTQVVILALIQAIVMAGAFYLLYRRVRPLTQVTETLGENAAAIKEASASLDQSATQIARANQNQAAATQETAASLEEIRSMVAQTANGATRLKESVETSTALVSTGKDQLAVVLNNLEAIDQANQQLLTVVDKGNQDVLGIVSIISEIGAKTKVIDDIVFQTKLLSFNASVEAARAGEHGKGFAVVAEEVGNLARMSGTAAKSISEMLESGILKIKSIIEQNGQNLGKSTQAGRAKVEECVKSAGLCQDTFNEIVSQVGSVNSASDEIAGALGEQRNGLDEIGKALGSLEASSQSNSASAEVASQNSGVLNGAVVSLSESIGSITVVIAGSNTMTSELVGTARADASKTHSNTEQAYDSDHRRAA